MLYDLETFPVTDKHQHILQVCENNWVRRIAGVKRVDRRRMDELREEVGIQKCLMGRLVKSRMKLAGHLERMREDRLPRMAYVHQERGKRKRGRPRMRWRDCIERNMSKAELEDVDWRMLAHDRAQWRMVVHRAAETCSHHYPWNHGNKEERDIPGHDVITFSNVITLFFCTIYTLPDSSLIAATSGIWYHLSSLTPSYVRSRIFFKIRRRRNAWFVRHNTGYEIFIIAYL